jgi:hypothetical protein
MENVIKQYLNTIEPLVSTFTTIKTVDVVKMLKKIDEYHEAELKKLRVIGTSGSTYTPSKAMDDYEFNTHRHWLDEQKQDDDDHGGTIKHFRD